MQENQAPTFEEFMKPSKTRAIALFVSLVLLIAAIAGIVIGSNQAAPEAIPLTHATKSGEYVSVDAMLLSEWIYRVSGDESYTFYECMDANGDWYVLSLNKSVYNELSELVDAYALINENTTMEDMPAPVTLYGMTRTFASDDIEALADAYDVSESENRAFFGGVYLDEGNEPGNAVSGVSILVALFTGLFALILGVEYASLVSRRKKCAERLYARAEEELSKTEFLSETNQRYPKSKLILSDHFIYSGASGAVVSYEDVALIFRSIQRIYGIQSSVLIVALTIDGRKIPLANKNVTDMLAMDVTAAVQAKNPNVLVGYTSENIKLWRARVKEYKAGLRA